jgi:hypothetical protein
MKRETAFLKSLDTGKIGLSALALTIVLLSGSAALALDPLGPPVSNLEPGQLRLGIDYSQSKMDLQLATGKWTQYILGLFDETGDASALTVQDFKTNNTYFNLGYGVDRNWEIFVRLSSTDAEFGDSLWEEGEKFESETLPAFGGGIKATFYNRFDLKIGGIVQANWSHYNGKLNTSQWYAPHFIETDFTEIQITLGATYMLFNSVWIYGGPLFHFISGDFNERYATEADTGGVLYSEWSYDLEQDSMYGGYLGATWEIDKSNSLNAEYQFTGAANAFGAGYVLKF